VKIDEFSIANRLKVSRFEVSNALNFLKNLELIDYIETSDQPEITYLTERLSDGNLENTGQNILFLKKKYTEQTESLLQFIQNDTTCRSVQLLHYFGEQHLEPCNKCDVCFSNQLKNDPASIEKIDQWILKKLATPKTTDELLAPIPSFKRGPIQSRLRILIDEEIIKVVNQLLIIS
jgi:ATP-dependent DNA helicase RecQ